MLDALDKRVAMAMRERLRIAREMECIEPDNQWLLDLLGYDAAWNLRQLQTPEMGWLVAAAVEMGAKVVEVRRG